MSTDERRLATTRRRAASTRQVASALADIARARQELDWLEAHLGELDVLARSAGHVNTETVRVRQSKATTGPVLSEQGQRVARQRVRDACAQLAHHVVELTATRVDLSRAFGAPGADTDLVGTDLQPGELIRLRAARRRRVANEGDLRWGEWEAGADQPDRPEVR